MATFFIDIYDTIIPHGDNKSPPFPKSVQTINDLYDKGHQIILTTARGEEYDFHFQTKYSKKKTIKMLEKHKIKYHQIVWNSSSPRIIINDRGAIGLEVRDSYFWENSRKHLLKY